MGDGGGAKELVIYIDERVFGDLDSFRQQCGQLREPGRKKQ